ncbi:880_t:CDS:2, partial [Funneliformis caledonium]
MYCWDCKRRLVPETNSALYLSISSKDERISSIGLLSPYDELPFDYLEKVLQEIYGRIHHLPYYKFAFSAHITLDVGLPPANVQSLLKTVCLGITKIPALASAITNYALSPASTVGDKCPTICACSLPYNCVKIRFTVEIILDNSQFLPTISLLSNSPTLPFKHNLKKPSTLILSVLFAKLFPEV